MQITANLIERSGVQLAKHRLIKFLEDIELSGALRCNNVQSELNFHTVDTSLQLLLPKVKIRLQTG